MEEEGGGEAGGGGKEEAEGGPASGPGVGRATGQEGALQEGLET